MTLGDVDPSTWVQNLAPSGIFDISWIMLASPVVVATASWRRLPLLGILPALFVSLVFYSLRPYTASAVEVVTLAVTALIVVVVSVTKFSSRLAPATWLACIAISVFVFDDVLNRLRVVASDSENLDRAYVQMHRDLGERGRTAYFAVSNVYRPLSIDSGFCKGALEIFNPAWNPLGYQAKAFPDKDCHFFAPQPVDPTKFSKAVMFSPDIGEPTAKAKERIEKFFAVDLSAFECRPSAAIPSGRYHICFKTGRD
jgi:hypothetical protein